MSQPDPTPHEPTRLGGFDRSGKVFVLSIFAVGGLLAGLALPYVADWASRLAWMPFQGPLELLGSFDQAWLVWGRPTIGAVIGLGLGLLIVQTTAVLMIDDTQIRIISGDDVTVIDRAKVDGVRRRGGRIVIVNAHGRELFAEEVEGGRDAAREAFTRHGYPWESG